MPSAHPPPVTRLTVAGGVYHEESTWPNWDEIYGSAGRAAAAVTQHVDVVRLVSCIREDTRALFQPYASAYGIELQAVPASQTISFDYFHSLSTPVIRPLPALISRQPDLVVEDEVVLRFGMLESSVNVKAMRCVYDPQSAFEPEEFAANGSEAESLAIVGNSAEISALSKCSNALDGAELLISSGAANVVIVKAGPQGSFVFDQAAKTQIPAFQTDFVWTLGTGDVFAGMFAARWGVHKNDPAEAAMIASKAVAAYVNSMSLPVPHLSTLTETSLPEVRLHKRKIYLAGPFFSMAQRWVVDEARRCLRDFGMDVFSPIHDVGPGPAEHVAPADLAGLHHCDAVFAILDGMDPGTLFEVGYARAINKPVYALAQAPRSEDLKMFEGSGCKIFTDFVTSIHHLAWRA